MRVLLTTAVLSSLTLAIILLRVFWSRVPARVRSFLVHSGLTMILIHVAFAVTKWSTTSDHLNSIINWGAVAGYQLIIVLFTLYRPRWLTTISAVILLLPVFASNILLPLGDLFNTIPSSITRMDKRYIYAKSLWFETGENRNSGADLMVFYQPRFFPLRRKVQRATFNDMQCDASASSASIDRTRKIIDFHCPASSTQTGSDPIDLILPLH
jgi:hypothetical protein